MEAERRGAPGSSFEYVGALVESLTRSRQPSDGGAHAWLETRETQSAGAISGAKRDYRLVYEVGPRGNRDFGVCATHGPRVVLRATLGVRPTGSTLPPSSSEELVVRVVAARKLERLDLSRSSASVETWIPSGASVETWIPGWGGRLVEPLLRGGSEERSLSQVLARGPAEAPPSQ